MKRIGESKSCYSLKKFQKERKYEVKLLKNLCTYPYQLDKGNSDTNFGKNNCALLKPPVFEKHLHIGGRLFLIKIYKKNKVLVIKGHDFKSTQEYYFRIQSKKAKKIIGDNKEYIKIANMLEFKDGILLLKGLARVNEERNIE